MDNRIIQARSLIMAYLTLFVFFVDFITNVNVERHKNSCQVSLQGKAGLLLFVE